MLLYFVIVTNKCCYIFLLLQINGVNCPCYLKNNLNLTPLNTFFKFLSVYTFFAN
jgi:hypothetical protein